MSAPYRVPMEWTEEQDLIFYLAVALRQLSCAQNVTHNFRYSLECLNSPR
jgi:hypothetical protein